VPDEGCRRHQRPGQRGALTKIHARNGGLLKSRATEQQLVEVVARPYFDSMIDPDARTWLRKLMAAAS
jgi:hypothetical protein